MSYENYCRGIYAEHIDRLIGDKYSMLPLDCVTLIYTKFTIIVTENLHAR